MEMTGLPSGTVYPAMRRLERDELIRSQWERQSIADAEQRPPRKYYKITAAGKSDTRGVPQALSAARTPHLDRGGQQRMKQPSDLVISLFDAALLRTASLLVPLLSARRMAP